MSKNPLDALTGNLGNHLGEYLREQRLLAKLSVRQLSALAGVSNPYLSQIERGVKRPSADILQQIAKGLSISAETLYVQAGLLDPKDGGAEAGANTRSAIRSDPALTPRQRQTLLEIYESFTGTDRSRTKDSAPKATPTKGSASSSSTAAGASSSRTGAKRTTAKKTTAKKVTAKKTAARTSATPKAPAPRAASTRASGTTSSPSTKGSPKASGSKNSKSTPRRSS